MGTYYNIRIERIGRLEAKEGKLSKTDVQYIMQNMSALRKRIEVLEVDYLHSVEDRLKKLEENK